MMGRQTFLTRPSSVKDVKSWVRRVEILAHFKEPSRGQNYLQSYDAASLEAIVAV